MAKRSGQETNDGSCLLGVKKFLGERGERGECGARGGDELYEGGGEI